MPIKPENKKLYPQNWKEIRERILTKCASRCEFCGVENHAIGKRDANGVFEEYSGMEAEVAALEGEKLIEIVLTIAHMDHNPTNNKPKNLKAL